MKKLILLTLALTACAKTDSSDILTSGIHASISASSTGDGSTNVGATLFLGNPINLNFVELTGDDALIATHAGQDKVMVETELLNVVGHNASFPTDAEGAEFKVAFVRTVDGGAPSSIATLPAKFTLDPPAASASRAAALTLTWSPAGSPDRMSWLAEGDCIEREASPINGDPGTFAIPPGTLKKRQGTTVADTCTITVSVIRARAGVLDPGYGNGGTITGNQVREATLSSTP